MCQQRTRTHTQAHACYLWEQRIRVEISRDNRAISRPTYRRPLNVTIRNCSILKFRRNAPSTEKYIHISVTEFEGPASSVFNFSEKPMEKHVQYFRGDGMKDVSEVLLAILWLISKRYRCNFFNICDWSFSCESSLTSTVFVNWDWGRIWSLFQKCGVWFNSCISNGV